MKILYFKDTDTALVEFSDSIPAETHEIAEDIIVDLDERGRLISMTIEHAKENAGLSELSFIEKQGTVVREPGRRVRDKG